MRSGVDPDYEDAELLVITYNDPERR